ncbi:MAG: transaldolase family protein [Candidatus Hadarchaeales archaeon]
MEIFLDTANIDEIKEIVQWGIISGVTTNQKIFLAEKGVSFRTRALEILSLVKGHLSLELTKTNSTVEELVEEAREYWSWDPESVVIKVPMFPDGRGLKIVQKLKEAGMRTNMTVLVNTNQVLLAAKAGADFASIFFNRAKDAGIDPVKVIRESKQIIEEGGFKTRIIVGSIRKPEDVAEAAVAGAHIITIPYKILKQMVYHPKTEETIAEFDRCWAEFRQAERKA